jgi:hypothetical protein
VRIQQNPRLSTRTLPHLDSEGTESHEGVNEHQCDQDKHAARVFAPF